MPTMIEAGQVQRAQALTIATALRLYARTGMSVNRAYTPRAMMRMATKLTGRKFRARAYAQAADALTEFAHNG